MNSTGSACRAFVRLASSLSSPKQRARPPFRRSTIRRLLDFKRERNPLPAGTSAIAAGLVVNGLSTYGFLIVARRAIGDEAYGGLAVLWGLIYILGPGLFQPLEQEVARATAARGARGEGSAPVLQQAAKVGFACLLVVCGSVLISWPLGLAGLLDHRIDLLIALLLGLAAFAAGELARGILSGRHQFGNYGRYFAAEGLSRILIASVLALIGVEVVGAYAVTVAAAFAIATVVASLGLRPFVNPGPPAHLNEITPALGLLLATSIAEAFLLNVGPVALSIVGDELGDEAPGVFLNGLIISRIPLFFFQAVKASLLPTLAAKADDHDLAGFRQVQFRLVAAVSVVAAVSTVVTGVIGPWLLKTLFGDTLSSVDMALLAASGGGLMILVALSLGLVALDHTRLAVVGFVVAVAVFPLALQLPNEPFLRVELGLLASVYVGAAITAVLLRYEFHLHKTAGRLTAAS